MNIPKDKLPLIRHNKGMYGQYIISCRNKDSDLNKNFVPRKHAGMVAYKDLSEYVVKATNNFGEAIDLINESAEQINLLLNGDDPTPTLKQLYLFLNKINKSQLHY